MMLSTSSNRTDYSGILPPASKTNFGHMNIIPPPEGSTTDKMMGITLTPERVQQQLQSPRRTRISQRMSAFTSPQRRLPTNTALAEGELRFFSRVTDSSSSSNNDSFYSSSQKFRQPVQSFHSSPQHSTTVSLAYISPATTPARSDVDPSPVDLLDSSFGGSTHIYHHPYHQPALMGGPLSTEVAPTIIMPVYPNDTAPGTSANPATTMSQFPVDAMDMPPQFFGTVQPIHLLEQQHEQLLLQQEQELLQRQLQKEFYEEQRCQIRERDHQHEDETILQRQLQHEFQNEQYLHGVDKQLFTIEEKKSDLEFHQSFEKIEQNLMPHSPMGGTNAVHTLISSSKLFSPSERKIIEHPLMNTQPGDLQVSPGPLPANVDFPNEPPTIEQFLSMNNSSYETPLERNDQAEASTIAVSDVHEISEQSTFSLLDLPPSSPRYFQPSELPTHLQKELVDRMMATTIGRAESHADLESQGPSVPTMAHEDRCTPRVSNSTSASEGSAASQTDIEKFSSEKDHNWPVEAVDSMKATMSRALGKLKILATHMANNSENPPPDAVNTSTESSSVSTSTCPETTSGFDLRDLADELRGTKGDASQTESHQGETSQAHHHRRDSVTSFDTLGAPKPASLAHTSINLHNLQKPVPLNPAIAHQKLPRAIKRTSDPGNKNSGSINIVPSPVAASRTRAVTPIVRMRHQGEEQRDTQAVEATQTVKDLDSKATKQMNRKNKSKTERKKGEAVQSIVENDTPVVGRKKSQRRRKSKPKSRLAHKEESFFTVAGQKYRVPAGIPTCRNDVIEILEKFMNTRCGNLDDTFEDDDYSAESNEKSFYSEEDESVFASETSSVSKFVKPSVATASPRNRRLNGRSEKGLSKTEPKHTITVDINNKQFIRQFIASATTKGILLMLHKVNHTKALRRPTKNLAFIRRGTPTSSGKFKGPKFAWKEVNGDEKGELDLFDIRSLEKATALELENYPLAMPGRSLFLRMNKGADYVFEARDEEEAVRFVHGMRWLIARLSFNLIIGNVSVSCELLEVERTNNTDDRYGMFPSTVKEETQWTMAMNLATNHLVGKASTSFQ
jgi:hypothetical protein